MITFIFHRCRYGLAISIVNLIQTEVSSFWIDNDEVAKALKNKDVSILDEKDVIYCVSNDYKCCVFIREHKAWYIENEGWRDANLKPDKENEGRLMLNFYKLFGEEILSGLCFKIFIPLNIRIESIQAEKDNYIIYTEKEKIRGRFNSIEKLVFHVVTGNAEKENEIETKFAKIAAI